VKRFKILTATPHEETIMRMLGVEVEDCQHLTVVAVALPVQVHRTRRYRTGLSPPMKTVRGVTTHSASR